MVFFREKFFCVPKVVPKKLLGSCIPLVNLWCIVAFPCQLRVHNGFLSQLTLQTIFSTTCAAIKSTPKSHELFRGPRTPCRAQGISCKCQQVYKSQKNRFLPVGQGDSASLREPSASTPYTLHQKSPSKAIFLAQSKIFHYLCTRN